MGAAQGKRLTYPGWGTLTGVRWRRAEILEHKLLGAGLSKSGKSKQVSGDGRKSWHAGKWEVGKAGSLDTLTKIPWQRAEIQEHKLLGAELGRRLRYPGWGTVAGVPLRRAEILGQRLFGAGLGRRFSYPGWGALTGVPWLGYPGDGWKSWKTGYWELGWAGGLGTLAGVPWLGYPSDGWKSWNTGNWELG